MKKYFDVVRSYFKGNKERCLTLLVVLILIGSLFLTYNIYQNKNKVIKTKRRKQNNLAIMIKEDGATDYTKSNSKDIPKGDYVLNRDKSYCKNNGKIGNYDNSLGKVSFSFIGIDSCFLYFDYEVPSVNILGVKIPLDTELDSSGTSSTKYIVSNENGYRYEGADPNNYICLDNKTSGACSSSSLLFRIIGLFEEEYSSNGTNSAGTKKLLKILDTNNYGGANGKYWSGSSSNYTNNWSKSTLNTELNETYLSTLLATSGVNSKLNDAIEKAKWHLGGANNTSESNYYYQTIITENYYKAERSPYATSGTLQNLYSGNPEYVFAKVGLMYPSDYGYATVGGSTTSKASCRAKELYSWHSSSFSDCKNNDWVYKSSPFISDGEWCISHNAFNSYGASGLNSSGFVANHSVYYSRFSVRPTFYLDSSILKIVGGLGTKDNAYRIG